MLGSPLSPPNPKPLSPPNPKPLSPPNPKPLSPPNLQNIRASVSGPRRFLFTEEGEYATQSTTQLHKETET